MFIGVAAVHGVEDAVAARLDRQVQIRHQLRLAGQRVDQRIVHIARVAGRETQAVNPANFRDMADELAQAPLRPVRTVRMVGIHILPDQRDFAYALAGE